MIDYKSAGVDTHKAQSYINNLKDVIKETYKGVPGRVIDNFGGFAGIFEPATGLNGYHLVAATDGVGTKIELARKFNYLDGLGFDLVAMCVNDLYCVGAKPLFFLDYISCGKLDSSWYNPVIASIAAACKFTKVALLGGESAEHPGVAKEDEFDLAGFCVGMVSPEKTLPDLNKISEGDLVYGFSSTGLHSNGFSLVRKLLSIMEKEVPEKYRTLTTDEEWIKKSLLVPTKIYSFVPELLEKSSIKALAHITGGGIYENLARVIPESFYAHIDQNEPFVLEIFDIFKGQVAPRDLFSTFNMGTGLIAIASEKDKSIIENYGGVVMGSVKKMKQKGSAKVMLAGIDF